MTDPLHQFCRWEKEMPQTLFLRQPYGKMWKTWTYQQAGDEARKIAAGIEALGLSPKSNVAILSKNCAQWIIADLAIMMTGHLSVPLYATLTAPSIRQILEHSESKAIIIGKLENYQTQKEGIPNHLLKIGIEEYGIQEEYSWEKWKNQNTPIPKIATWQGGDLLTIMYTSGTTQKPKGVMHTVSNFYHTQVGMNDLGVPMHPNVFSFLPLSHIAERIAIEMSAIYRGGTLSFAESIDTFATNLAHSQPDIFFAVPRIWVKFQEKVLEKIPQKKLDNILAIPIISTIVKNRIRKKMGFAKTKALFSGAAPISIELLKWFDSIGITILQGIGMTEDAINSHCNRKDKNKFGTVGICYTGVKSKISAEGELLIKSPSNMIGYYKEPELTHDAFDSEGYLRTGDKAEIDAEGFLTIVGRIKDQFKTNKGKYVSPAPIEMHFLSNPDIEQVCVVGVGIPHPLALVVLSPLGKENAKEKITHSLSTTLEQVNTKLESYEKIKRIIIVQHDWTIENGLLTPTLKMKRNEIENTYSSQYLNWYNTQTESVIWEVTTNRNTKN